MLAAFLETTVAKKDEVKAAPSEVAPIGKAHAGEVVVQNNMADDFGSHAGAGMETVTARDMLIPRLTIIQALSPQLKPRDSNFIEGAKVGDICDVGTSEIFDQPLAFLPCAFNKVWLEWAPRKSGKGLVAIHTSDAILQKCSLSEKNQQFHGENIVIETSQVFGLNMNAMMRRSFISFASTQTKKAKKWLTLANGEILKRSDGSLFTPPFFYRIYNLTSTEESNNEGDWAGWRIDRGDILPSLGENWKDVMKLCVDFQKSILAGEVLADEGSAREAGGGGEVSSNNEGAM